MENLNAFVNEANQVNEEKPPPRACPRCNSDNTKFCYYNNYSVSQPRYFCKNCRRYWTHGGALRNIPVGGSGRKSKRTTRDQTSVSQVSQVVSVDIQQVNHHQPYINVRENNEFLGSFGGSSSSSATVVMNHFGSLPSIHGGMLTNVTPMRNLAPMDRLENFSEGTFQQNYFDVGSNDLIGIPSINQSIGGNVDNHSDFRMNQEDQNKWNQSFMSMNPNASTSGSGGYSTIEMNNNNNMIRNSCVFRSSYHLEKHGP